MSASKVQNEYQMNQDRTPPEPPSEKNDGGEKQAGEGHGHHHHHHGDKAEGQSKSNAEAVLKLLDAHSAMVVLDAATGSGDTAICLAPHVREVVAIDESEKAIDRCRENVEKAALNNVCALVMPVEKISFPDGTFDAVTCRFATHHFKNIGFALAEMRRVLKEKGAIVIADRLSADEQEFRLFIQTIGKLRDSTFTTIHTFGEWQSMLAAVDMKVVRESRFKETIDVTAWLERSPLTDEQKKEMHEAFAAASDAVKEYFQVQFEGGKAISYTDDKIVLRAERRA